MNATMIRHSLRLAFTLFLLVPLLAGAGLVPRAPQIEATAYVLMDATTGHLIVEHNVDERLPPASLTKIMTDYIAAREIDRGNLNPRETTTVSVRAWRMGGSRMFIQEGSQVSIEDLIKGVIISSGNDASVALAEHIAGSEEAFADLMNQHARRLGMENSNFTNSTGWPDEDQYTSARDMAILSRALIREHPENYSLYREKSFTYNDITQRNRNLLLWRDESVDGIKTGHTRESGYSLVSSAERDGMRLISVVMGTNSEQARARESQSLLNYGFRFFETYKAYDAGESLTPLRVWMGADNEVNLGASEDLVVTIPKDSHENLSAEMSLDSRVRAPVQAGDELGAVTISLNGDVLLEKPLVALSDVERGGIFRRLIDRIALFFRGLFS